MRWACGQWRSAQCHAARPARRISSNVSPPRSAVARASIARAALESYSARVGGIAGFYTWPVPALLPDSAFPRRLDPDQAAARIRAIAAELGFQRVGIAGVELDADEGHLR